MFNVSKLNHLSVGVAISFWTDIEMGLEGFLPLGHVSINPAETLSTFKIFLIGVTAKWTNLKNKHSGEKQFPKHREKY